jgi:ribosomal protein RSM22 (predicted rRNA methylase)
MIKDSLLKRKILKEKCSEVYKMGKREDYELVLNNLKSAQNEEEVFVNITKIIKGFSSEYYKNDLYENPYFKSIIPDVKKTVISEMNEVRKSIVDEINSINLELTKTNTQSKYDDSYDKLKSLKRDCVNLLIELDNRLEELNSL